MKAPTEPGYYYYRHPHAPRQHIWVAQVSRVASGSLFATIYSDLERDRVSHRDVTELRGQWFGPLPTPGDLGA